MRGFVLDIMAADYVIGAVIFLCAGVVFLGFSIKCWCSDVKQIAWTKRQLKGFRKKK
jgi:hypothetical protein